MGEVKVADYLVVGAGMAGAAIAADLSHRGRVVILESEEHAGYHSTGRSAAFFSENYGNALIRALSRASRNFIFEPDGNFTAVPLCRPRLGLYFATHGQLEEMRRFREDPNVLRTTQEITAAEVRSHIPILREDYLTGGILEHGAADLDVDALHQGFIRQARSRSAEIFFDCPVRELRREGGRWIATTPRGAIGAPVVVNAAGAWGDEIATLASVPRIGLEPRRRTALLIPVPGGLSAESWPAAVNIREDFYFKPDAGLLLLSPADEHPCAPCDAQPEELDIAIAIDRFEQATGAQVRQVKRSWAGLRVFTPDRSPVIGFDPSAEGFFWLAGLGGYGIQTAPAVGRLAATLASGEAVPEDIMREGVTSSMVSPARFQPTVQS
jgi:D-arginine dehydrogenase